MATTSPSMAKTPKSMSSRLLTMKFMQRAAASAPASLPAPTTPDEPSPKRQKLEGGSSPSTPSADLRAVQAAVAAEEAKREEALERQAAEAGESKWFLSFRAEDTGGVGASLGNGSGNGRGALRVTNASYSGLDHEYVSMDHDEGSSRPAAVVGRRSFGRFNRALEKRLNGNDEASSSSEDDMSENANNVHGIDDNDAETILIRASRDEATQRLKAERKAQRRAAKAEAARLAEKRKSKEVKLNKLGSISNGGNAMISNMECFSCGGKGHRKNECPEPKRKEKRRRGG